MPGPIYLPNELQKLLADEPVELDSVGRSESQVLMFADKVLKIQPETRETQTEQTMMKWLAGKIPVPCCLYHTAERGESYLLMSRIGGQMSCHERYLQDPVTLVRCLADTLKRLWEIDVSDCPVRWNLQEKLAAARVAVELGTVEIGDAEPGTFGDGGFRDPQHLLAWLIEHQPEEDPVLSHGDFCLPNVFLDGGQLSGLIDLGRMGVADRWQDIALCWRSLQHNCDGTYTGKVYGGFDPGLLFEALEIEPDWEKIRYYILLDELF